MKTFRLAATTFTAGAATVAVAILVWLHLLEHRAWH